MRVAWPIILILLIPLGVAFYYRINKPRHKKPVGVAETKTLDRLPSIKKAKARAKLLKIAELSIVGIIIVLLVALIARPQATVLKIDEERTRDIVMCIDTSGSMKDYHQKSIQLMKEAIAKNPTDKYSVVLFSNVAFTAIPLSRDVASLNLKLDDIEEHLHPENLVNEYRNSAVDYSLGSGGTDISAGLIGCLKRFSDLDTERSRHVIFVSDMDNTDSSDPREPATLYAKYGVDLHVLYPDSFLSDDIQNDPALKIANAKLNNFSRENGIDNTLNDIFSTIQNQDDALVYAAADDPYPYFIAISVLLAILAAIGIYREGWKQ